jgi:predicted ATPase
VTADPARATNIRTPDQRLRVFVSSTLVELADERAAVARAISSLRLTPVQFELGARPHPPRELYRAYLAQSDIFIGLYWQRYGWIASDMDISGLEDEFQLSGSMPRLLYIKGPAPDREPRLSAMIEKIESTAADSYRPFRSARELGRLVRDDLALLLSERFSFGQHVSDPSPAAPRRSAARSLPAVSTSLIGRARDIVEVVSMLESPDVRLVTLTGPGGIGKTRLAIAVGERLDGRYPRGTEFVPLASIAQPELVLPKVAADLGVSIEGTRPAIDALAEHFAGVPSLLVLDNLEQVVRVAPDLDQLLARCPELRILATSRTVLRLRAEREYAVSSLTIPSSVEQPSVDDVSALESVQLFVDRARAVRREFGLNGDNVSAVVDICRRLDGLPLAIELAAARVRLLEPRALVARLESQLDSLGTGPVDLPERQRTLRATVEWSVDLLTAEEQRVLAILSVFVDGWTLEAATHVADLTEDRTLDLLDALAGHSLVNVDASAAGPRFRMLVSVGEYAAERLTASGDAALIEQRHAEYFGALVANDDWPTERQAEWAQQWRTEEENLRRAIRWFFAHDITPLPNMFRILWLYWQMRDRLRDGSAWIGELWVRADELHERGQAQLALIAAVTTVEVGDDDGAMAAFERIESLHDLDDPFLTSALQLAVSWILPIVDDFDGSREKASAALDELRAQGEPMVAFATLTVGMLEMLYGNHDVARTLLTEASDFGRQFDNNLLQSAAGAGLVSVAVRTGDLGAARARLTSAVSATAGSELGTIPLSFLLISLAQVALGEGDGRRAARALGAVEGLRSRAGLRAWPITRRAEAELEAAVRAACGTAVYDGAFAEGSALTTREAVALVRGKE